ncbi:Acyl-CoA thioesterase FadM [Moraxella cuniculi DSM 21768]|uniref:Acyl-CoA thioesterase FadM n=2 Tax=Moraxella cuniculi TaxID=34061 RepID=A0A1N7DT70_9GAMM|nr:acyl-CoA thioesterase [Moraxella cuniculi]OOS07487.1 thioeseterase [Moraxella cuniculi]SIR79093.1 Acyl-CoA thioesterase FadM [Moraxella cuniculi DSM 21768]VEG12636.1 Thioesterase superfamily [Moraxella cuniculi]
MYPFIRLGKTIAKSTLLQLQGKTLAPTDTSEISFVSGIHDIDNFLEMNNGRIFTLFDLGRTDFAIRTGLGKKLLANRWGLVVAGSSIQYRKRVRLFDKITIKTRLCAIDERWFYIEQTMYNQGTPSSQALLRTGVTNLMTGKTIPTQTVLTAIGHGDLLMPADDWVAAWIAADKLRNFPID